MNLRREARTLKTKALCSLRRALGCFNGFDEDGRITSVLLHLQHACEMLLKSILIQSKVEIFDSRNGTSLGFEKCINLARSSCGLTDTEAGVMRAINSLRGAAQHWIIFVPEDLLYLHARALVGVFDDILLRNLDDRLAVHLPIRVLPISTAPVTNVDLLVNREYEQIRQLLAPGRRARSEARGRIRTLLAMEAHVVDEIRISEKDIDRIENAIRARKAVEDVFPRLRTLATNATGDGFDVKVHFTKKQGAPVRFVSGDDPEEAAAVRELDLQKKFHMQANDLAKALKLTRPKANALRAYAGVDSDKQCTHEFEFKSQKIKCFSDNAIRRMSNALQSESMDEIWAKRRINPRT
jgi:hypothetical protein